MFVFCLHCFDLKWTQKKTVEIEQKSNFSCLASLVRSLIAVLQCCKYSTVNLPTDQELFSYHLGFQIFALTSAIKISWKIPTMPKLHKCLTLQGFACNFIIFHQAATTTTTTKILLYHYNCDCPTKFSKLFFSSTVIWRRLLHPDRPPRAAGRNRNPWRKHQTPGRHKEKGHGRPCAHG